MIKNRLCYIISLIILILGYIYTGDYFYIFMFLFLISFEILFFVINIFVLKKINVDLLFDSYTGLKELEDTNNSFIISIQNRSIIPIRRIAIYLEYNDNINNNKKSTKRIIYVPLLEKNKENIKYSFGNECSRIIDIKIRKIKVFDPLCIGAFKRKIDKTIQLTIMPQVESSKCAVNKIGKINVIEDINECARKNQHHQKFSNSLELDDYRKYRDGDNLNRVNWKLSAKKDQIYVKNCKNITTQNGLIIIENIVSRNNSYDKILKSIIEISSLMIEKQINHSIIWFDSKTNRYVKEEIQNTDQTYSCVRHFMKCSIENINHKAYDYLKSNTNKYSNIFYITNRKDTNINDGIYQNVNIVSLEEGKNYNNNPSDGLENISATYEEKNLKVKKLFSLLDGIFISLFILCFFYSITNPFELGLNSITLNIPSVIFIDAFVFIMVSIMLLFIYMKRSKKKKIVGATILSLFVMYIVIFSSKITIAINMINDICKSMINDEMLPITYSNKLICLFVLVLFLLIAVFSLLFKFGYGSLFIIMLTSLSLMLNICMDKKSDFNLCIIMVSCFFYTFYKSHKNVLLRKNNNDIFKKFFRKFFFVDKSFYRNSSSYMAFLLSCISIFSILVVRIIVLPDYINNDKINYFRLQCKNITLNDKFLSKEYNYLVYGKVSGGIRGGKLGDVDKIEYDNTTHLIFTTPEEISTSIFQKTLLKGYVGDEYTGNSFAEDNGDDFKEFLSQNGMDPECIVFNSYQHDKAAMDLISKINKDDIDTDKFDAYYAQIISKFTNVPNVTIIPTIPTDDNKYYDLFSGIEKSKGKIENINANKKYIYTPYESSPINDDFTYNKDLYLKQAKAADNYSFEYFHDDLNQIQNFEKYAKQSYKDSSAKLKSVNDVEALYKDYVYNKYTKLPEDGLDIIKSKYKKTNIDINDYQRYIETVRYDICKDTNYTLEPGKTPKDKDFVEYFLYENKKGYCVHYAAAATVIFRAMGIPARYVEGYVVKGDQSKMMSPNENYVVESTNRNKIKYENKRVNTYLISDSDAHAWTEIYIDGFGWYPVDLTKSSDSFSDVKVLEVNKDSEAMKNTQTSNNDAEVQDNKEDDVNNEAQNEISDDFNNNSDNQTSKSSYLLGGIIVTIIILIALRILIIKLIRMYRFKNTDSKAAVRNMSRYFNKLLIISHINTNAKYSDIIKCIKERYNLSEEEGIKLEKAFVTILKAKFSNSEITKEDKNNLLCFISEFRKKCYLNQSFCGKIKFKVKVL